MKATLSAIAVLLCACACFGHEKQPPDPFKPTLDRLKSLAVLPIADWKYHADVAHPEDVSLDDSSWQVVKTRESWKNGSRVLRRWIEIPETI
jgi:hypothetical protein